MVEPRVTLHMKKVANRFEIFSGKGERRDRQVIRTEDLDSSTFEAILNAEIPVEARRLDGLLDAPTSD